MRGAFACAVDRTGLDVAAVDDGMTTGAMRSTYARRGQAAQATRADLLVVARTLRPHC